MRETKFRAWHESKNGQVMLQVGDKYGTTHPLDCCNYALQGQNITLMQYTGLKDKNGVEIYEGDIIQWAGFEVANGKQIRPERRLIVEDFIKDTHRLICITEGTGQTVEVIGNIYENKELLGGAMKNK